MASLAGAPVDLVKMAIGFAAFGGGLLIVAFVSGGMGMGDVKLAALIGLVHGLPRSAVRRGRRGRRDRPGGIGAVDRARLRARPQGRRIPFGPYLAGGAVVAAFWGEALSRWYLGALVG